MVAKHQMNFLSKLLVVQLSLNLTMAQITEVSYNQAIMLSGWFKRKFLNSNDLFSTDVGVLACLDGYMNIALEQTEEYSNGQLKNKYGDAFIRGNNVLYISTQKRRAN